MWGVEESQARERTSRPASQWKYKLHIAAIALRRADKQAVGTPARRAEMSG